MKIEQSVLKRRHIKLRRLGITQKKNIQYLEHGESLNSKKLIKMEQTECSETSAYEIQTPGNYTEENIQCLEQGESLK
jgi:hypothetical protein